LSAAPPSVAMWYNLMLAMVGETTSKSYPAPAMFFMQSEVLKPMDVSIHLWWSVALSAGAATATVWCNVLMTRLDVISQESPYMM
jgi:hypothetical protein